MDGTRTIERQLPLVAILEGKGEGLPMGVPEMVRGLARDRGWPLTQLARECDIPIDSLRGMVYGKSANPTLDTLQRLAKGTGRPLTEIVGMLGDKEPEPDRRESVSVA